ncbi:diflavin flavoprotein [Thermosynechococcaceae cyanobacterium BACA0444]|uniref:Diflavin flavoprotein n=1 Tax=Pseudocalidococcus azoricus BACA0444 TaxID=2918990 RepID=A0AAE4FS95_9CYAN|nr:diflavin flavoprotein [Pseudocalidococcus azoricus]MDS3860387.1 diflavin flavoprotein [Pseudocalidococcus azoricus BACA0444]
MVVASATRPARLTLETQAIAPDTTALRCLDWDRERFDIEFGLENGTTYNSFIIRGEKLALVDTSHAKFRDIYLEKLWELIDPTELDYLIISHTEPDHSGLVKDVLAKAPQVVVVGSKVALQFLSGFVHQPFQQQIIKNGDQIDLGHGHSIEFVMAPNLHWPDTILSYDHGTQTLFTCDVFGMHYCNDDTYDSDPEVIAPDFKFYYDCLMGPNARSVLSALKRMGDLPEVKLIATGHGPLLKEHLTDWVENYRIWSQAQAKAAATIALFYQPGYGYSDVLAEAINRGASKTGVVVEPVDLTTTDQQEVREIVDIAAGIIIGMPDSTAQTSLSTILATAHNKQAIGVFETGVVGSEAAYPLFNQFRDLGLTPSFPVIRVAEAPHEALLQQAEEAGTDMGQWLLRDRTVKQMKSLDTDLDKALGRLSGGLYIITAQKGDINSAMLASWVAQASVEPLGVTIAVAKDRAIESFMHVGDTFVLNVLEEGNYQPLMRHFLKRFPPGADRFATIKTYPANNGSPILADALAYVECTVVNRLDCHDHWLVYSTIETGRVSKPDALTAVHHRKVGNHY